MTECTVNEPSTHLRVLKGFAQAYEFGEYAESPKGEPGIVEMKMQAGTSHMFNLYKGEHIAVARQFASGGSVFPRHQHKEWELLLVYLGEMKLTIDGQAPLTLGPRGYAIIEPDTPHSATFSCDTWFIAHTLPASMSWPGQ